MDDPRRRCPRLSEMRGSAGRSIKTAVMPPGRWRGRSRIAQPDRAYRKFANLRRHISTIPEDRGRQSHAANSPRWRRSILSCRTDAAPSTDRPPQDRRPLPDGRRGDTRPRMLPAKSQSLGNFFTGQTRTLQEGRFETRRERLPEGQAQIRIAEQFTEPIIDQSSHQIPELFRRQRGEVHVGRIRRLWDRLQPGTYFEDNWVSSRWMNSPSRSCSGFATARNSTPMPCDPHHRIAAFSMVMGFNSPGT